MMLHDSAREKKIEEGLELIIRHFDNSEPIWPRWISTYINTGLEKKQRFWLAHNKQEVLALYKAANYLDCRIKAYGSDNAAPSLLHVDIDREHFNTTEEFELAAAKTRANFKEILDARSTQMWTGNGYHFLQPQFAIVLERVEMFKEFDQASRKFLHFEELKISNKKADPTHCKTVSFNNCWLRIPGSLNSNHVRFNENGEIIDIPPEAEVRVIQYWDGERPSIKPLLPRYYIWRRALMAKDIDEQMEAEQKAIRRKYRQWDKKNTISWIERLVDKPLNDHRKFCIRRVFVPYLINVSGLSCLLCICTTLNPICQYVDERTK